MRIFRTINENVPEHFCCFGTFFSCFFGGVFDVSKLTQNTHHSLAFYNPAHEVPEPEHLHSVLSQFAGVKRALDP